MLTVKAGTTTVVWTQATRGALLERTGFNLAAQLAAITNDKYKKPSDHDDEFKRALSGAQMNLKKLERDAKSGKEDAEKIIVDLKRVCARCRVAHSTLLTNQ